jgi:hypothetical protein
MGSCWSNREREAEAGAGAGIYPKFEADIVAGVYRIVNVLHKNECAIHGDIDGTPITSSTDGIPGVHSEVRYYTLTRTQRAYC